MTGASACTLMPEPDCPARTAKLARFGREAHGVELAAFRQAISEISRRLRSPAPPGDLAIPRLLAVQSSAITR